MWVTVQLGLAVLKRLPVLGSPLNFITTQIGVITTHLTHNHPQLQLLLAKEGSSLN